MKTKSKLLHEDTRDSLLAFLEAQIDTCLSFDDQDLIDIFVKELTAIDVTPASI